MAKVGILGHGVVGSGVAQILLENADVLEARAGEKIELARVCDLREFDVGYKALFTKDAAEVYSDPEIGIVVECMGGKGAAYRFGKRQACCDLQQGTDRGLRHGAGGHRGGKGRVPSL